MIDLKHVYQSQWSLPTKETLSIHGEEKTFCHFHPLSWFFLQVSSMTGKIRQIDCSCAAISHRNLLIDLDVLQAITIHMSLPATLTQRHSAFSRFSSPLCDNKPRLGAMNENEI
jgi:hypothetical protein